VAPEVRLVLAVLADSTARGASPSVRLTLVPRMGVAAAVPAPAAGTAAAMPVGAVVAATAVTVGAAGAAAAVVTMAAAVAVAVAGTTVVVAVAAVGAVAAVAVVAIRLLAARAAAAVRLALLLLCPSGPFLCPPPRRLRPGLARVDSPPTAAARASGCTHATSSPPSRAASCCWP